MSAASTRKAVVDLLGSFCCGGGGGGGGGETSIRAFPLLLKTSFSLVLEIGLWNRGAEPSLRAGGSAAALVKTSPAPLPLSTPTVRVLEVSVTEAALALAVTGS